MTLGSPPLRKDARAKLNAMTKKFSNQSAGSWVAFGLVDKAAAS
jgi:hypothetical protein